VELAGGADDAAGLGPRTPVRWVSLPSFAQVLALPADVVGVDMPIGLPERGRRGCDLAAKARLGSCHARVFLAPPRAVRDAPDHAGASALHRLLVDGKGMSIQTWHILRKVAEVEAALADAALTDAALADAALVDAAPKRAREQRGDVHRRVVEVHPELSFTALVGHPLPSKRTPEGRAARIAALRIWLPGLAARDVPLGNDHLDALAAAWSAARWREGTATVLPDGLVPRDRTGVPQRVVV
jgi:predicted RNase H-like nuclease